jgi:hypothetical protein
VAAPTLKLPVLVTVLTSTGAVVRAMAIRFERRAVLFCLSRGGTESRTQF